MDSIHSCWSIGQRCKDQRQPIASLTGDNGLSALALDEIKTGQD